MTHLPGYDGFRFIGGGTFGEVYKAHKKGDPSSVVAIKIIKSIDDSKKAVKEARMMTSYRHDNIVSLYNAFEMENRIYLVMEFCDGGNLHKFIESNRRLSEETTRQVLRPLTSAISFLHSKQVIHRDLKPLNIFLKSSGDGLALKVGDFGESTILPRGSLQGRPYGTAVYMAPEVYLQEPYGFQSDIWSMGVIIFQCITGNLPNDVGTTDKLVKYYRGNPIITFRGENASRLPRGTSPDLVDLLEGMLKVKPNSRYDINKVKAHAFLRRW